MRDADAPAPHKPSIRLIGNSMGIGKEGMFLVNVTGNPRVTQQLPVPLPERTRTHIDGYGLPA